MGTTTPPAHQTAKSASVHSYRVLDISPTRSPGLIPASIMPLASAVTSARNSRQDTSCQAPPERRLNSGCSGASAALRPSRSVRLASGSCSLNASTLISRTACSRLAQWSPRALTLTSGTAR